MAESGAHPLKIHRRAPTWAIGVVSVFASLGVCIVTIYMTARPEISQYATESFKTASKKADVDSLFLTKVLDLVTSNTQQISAFSRAVITSQEMNIKLTDRVSVVEKELAIVKTLLSKCELDLSKSSRR